jgi:hypothetical protein
MEVINLVWQMALFNHENVYMSYSLYAILLLCFLVTYWFGPPSPRTQDTISLVFYLVGGSFLLLGMQERYMALMVAAMAMLLAAFLHSTYSQTVIDLVSPGRDMSRVNSSYFDSARRGPPHNGALFSPYDAAPPSNARANPRQLRLDTLRDESAQSPARITTKVSTQD